ncbi:hypothetical protein [Cohnella mopanensis]|uniref:hypothetical protein n=1 Tax=Cohnella mopanensis TaxID=2911966 RepID=UPI001EF79AD8|nr:hypothetical protein [Cohnella mopanensis]
MKKPVVYHPRKNSLNCYEYLLASFISKYDFPYQWLFSDNWGFYYAYGNEFSAWMGDCPRDVNLTKIYGVTDTFVPEFRHLIQFMSKVQWDEECFIISADAIELPWHPNYTHTSSIHMVIVDGYCAEKGEAHVVDWFPEYSGWIPLRILDLAWKKGNRMHSVFSKPIFIGTNSLLVDQLKLCRSNMAGEQYDHGLTGLLGVERLKMDIISYNESDFDYDKWWAGIFQVISARDTFLEFIYYVHNEIAESSIKEMYANFIVVINNTVQTWMTFRNGIMRSKLTKDFQIDKNVERLEKIILLEKECLEFIDNLLNAYKETEPVYG